MSRTAPAWQRRPRPSSARRSALWAFAAFALMALAWSLAMPADGTTDERQHLERAYGAVSGQLLGPQDLDPMVHRPGAAFEVPKSLLPPNALCVYFPNYRQTLSWVARPASCQEPAPATHAKVRVVSWVGRYNPLYYLAVGAPLRFWPDLTGIVLSRILAALLSSAFAAAAAMVAIRTRRPLLLAALLTVLTPTAIALNSTVNPNGIEISAALLLWVCLVDLARPGEAGSAAEAGVAGAAWRGQRGVSADSAVAVPEAGSAAARRWPRQVSFPVRAAEPGPAARPPLAGMAARFRRAMRGAPGSTGVSQPALLLLAAISGAVVLTVRAEGPFWFALALCGSLAVAERGRIRDLLRWRAARLAAAAWTVTAVLAEAWNMVSGNGKVTHTLIAEHFADDRVSTLLRVIAANRVGGWFAEAFALDVPASWAPMLWAALAAAVLVPPALLRTRRVLLVALAVAAASLGITVVLEITFLSTFGWSQYGRYFLPGLAGTAVLLASGPVGDLPPALRRRIPRLFAVGAAFCQLWVLAVEMSRVQAGPAAPLNPLAGSWHPAAGSLTVLAVAALGAAALVAVVWTATAAETPVGTLSERASAPRFQPAAGTGGATVPTAIRRASGPPIEPQVVPEPANS